MCKEITNGNFIDDNAYAIKVDLILLSKDKDGKVQELTYPMERLEKVGLDSFIESFSMTKFELKEMKYNSQNRISKITLKQLET